MEVVPSDEQIKAAFDLINYGVRLKFIAENYKIYPASVLRNTQSPGTAFIKIIEKWKHYSDEP
jgi:N-acetylmuramoyl-L-alanine amidase